MNEFKLLLTGKVRFKKLYYGFLSKHHANKAIAYKGRYYAVEYHRNLAHYYFFKAFGEEHNL